MSTERGDKPEITIELDEVSNGDVLKENSRISRRAVLEKMTIGTGGVVVGAALKTPVSELIVTLSKQKSFASLRRPEQIVTPSPTPEVIEEGAFYGDNLIFSSVSLGEYKKTDDYKTNHLEGTTKYYVLKNYPEHKDVLKDKGLVRMLGRVHEAINAPIDFENIQAHGDYGQEMVELLQKGYLDLLINAWKNADQFAKLDNLFNVFKYETKDIEQRNRREKAAGEELYGFLQLVKEHAKTAHVRENKVYNDFPSGTWDYPRSTVKRTT